MTTETQADLQDFLVFLVASGFVPVLNSEDMDLRGDSLSNCVILGSGDLEGAVLYKCYTPRQDALSIHPVKTLCEIPWSGMFSSLKLDIVRGLNLTGIRTYELYAGALMLKSCQVGPSTVVESRLQDLSLENTEIVSLHMGRSVVVSMSLRQSEIKSLEMDAGSIVTLQLLENSKLSNFKVDTQSPINLHILNSGLDGADLQVPRLKVHADQSDLRRLSAVTDSLNVEFEYCRELRRINLEVSEEFAIRLNYVDISDSVFNPSDSCDVESHCRLRTVKAEDCHFKNLNLGYRRLDECSFNRSHFENVSLFDAHKNAKFEGCTFKHTVVTSPELAAIQGTILIAPDEEVSNEEISRLSILGDDSIERMTFKDTVFRACELMGYISESSWENCRFENCKLVNLALRKVSFIQCEFVDCEILNVSERQVTLQNCRIEYSKLYTQAANTSAFRKASMSSVQIYLDPYQTAAFPPGASEMYMECSDCREAISFRRFYEQTPPLCEDCEYPDDSWD